MYKSITALFYASVFVFSSVFSSVNINIIDDYKILSNWAFKESGKKPIYHVSTLEGYVIPTGIPLSTMNVILKFVDGDETTIPVRGYYDSILNSGEKTKSKRILLSFMGDSINIWVFPMKKDRKMELK